MLLHREILSLVIVALAAFSNVAAASSTDRRLRGSSSNLLADELPSEEVPSFHDVDSEERKLKREREPKEEGGGGGGKGGGKGKQTTETGSTEAPLLPLPEEPAGGAEAPPANSTSAPTPTPIPAVCEPACGADEMCARSSPSAEAQCYPKCSGFPIAVNTTDACAGTDTCVYSTFTCGGYEGVFNEFCQCSIDGSYGCLLSDCGLAAP